MHKNIKCDLNSVISTVYVTLNCMRRNTRQFRWIKILGAILHFVISSCLCHIELYKAQHPPVQTDKKIKCDLNSVISIVYASVNSSCAHAPPRAHPRVLALFFSRMANSRGWGHFRCQMPRGVDEGRGQMPRPRHRTSPINTAAVFIHCTIIPLSAFLCVIFNFCRRTSPSSIVCNGTI